MEPRFGNSSISIREVIIGLKGFEQKKHFLRGVFFCKNLGLAVGMTWKYFFLSPDTKY